MLARALALEPEVLLLDEPTASLDAAATGAVERRSARPRRRVARPRDPRPRSGRAARPSERSSSGKGGSRVTQRPSRSRSARSPRRWRWSPWPIAVSFWRRAELEQDIAVAVMRSFIQLTAVGYVIQAIFDSDSLWLVVALLAGMVGLRHVDRARTREGSAGRHGPDRAGARRGGGGHARARARARRLQGEAALPRAGRRHGDRQLDDRGGGGAQPARGRDARRAPPDRGDARARRNVAPGGARRSWPAACARG